MKCDDARAALEDLVNMRDIRLSSSDLKELVGLELIARVGPEMPSSSDGEMNALREDMRAIRAEKSGLESELQKTEEWQTRATPRKLYKEHRSYRERMDKLDELEKRERALRTELLNLVHETAEKRYHANVNGNPFYVTYKGKELLGELGQRIHRVGETDLKRFVKEMNTIKSHFNERSSQARKILKKISPKFPTTDEMHLRSAAVGLSSRIGEHAEASELFIEAFQEISKALGQNGASSVTLAESLSIVAKDNAELRTLVEQATNLIQNTMPADFDIEDRIRAASIIMSSEGDAEAMLEHAMSLSKRGTPENPSVAALLASQFGTKSGKVRTYSDWIGARDEEGGVFWKFVNIHKDLGQEVGDVLETAMAAALLSSADISIEVATERYRNAMAMLQRLGVGEMRVPSAMIAVLPAGLEESMDNLRLAAASIGANRLSLGGVENLSLGMKLLMHSAAIPVKVDSEAKAAVRPLTIRSHPVPSVLTIAGVSVAAGLALSAGILAFHEFSFHRRAVQDYAFHPVHFHYVYG